MKNTTIKNLFLSAVAVSTLASCQKDFYLEDLEDSQKIVASLEFTNETLTAEIAQLELSVDAANYTINQNEIAIAGLEGDNVALTVENDILKAIIEGLEASIYVLEELLKEKDDAILVLDSSSTTYQTDITNITAEKDALLVQMNDHSAELADAIAQIYALKELILVQANEINSLEAENAALRAQVAAFQTQLAGAGAGVDTSSEALAEAEAALVVANNEILSLTGTVSTTEEALRVSRFLLNGVQNRLDDALSSGSSNTTLIADLEARIVTLTTTVSMTVGRLDQATRDYDRVLGERNDARAERDIAEASLTVATTSLASLTLEVNEFVLTLLTNDDLGASTTNNGYTLVGYPYTPAIYQDGYDSVNNQIYNSTINTNNNTITLWWGFRRGVEGGSMTVTFDNKLDAALFFVSNTLRNEMPTTNQIIALGGSVSSNWTIGDDGVTTRNL